MFLEAVFGSNSCLDNATEMCVPGELTELRFVLTVQRKYLSRVNSMSLELS